MHEKLECIDPIASAVRPGCRFSGIRESRREIQSVSDLNLEWWIDHHLRVRIAVIFKDGTANAYYRAILPLAELQRRGHTVLWPGEWSLDAALARQPEWDLLHVQQFIADDDLASIRQLRERGVAVVWDSDDDVQAAPKGSDPYKALGRRRGLRKHFKRTVDIAAAAQLMTTPSPHLAQVYRDAGVEHVAAIENYVAARDVGARRRRHAGLVIGMTAAGEHDGDLRQMRIAETLERILRAHDGVRVVAIGCDLKLRDRYAHRSIVPITELVAHESEFDIGLAPLLDTPFNRARSNIKLKEYAAAGATWLASPVGPYRGMGEQQGGQLVGDDDWYDAIERLILDYRRRSELAVRARAWVAGQTIERAGAQWERAFVGAAERARNGNGAR